MSQLSLSVALDEPDTTETSPTQVAQPETAREQVQTLWYQGRTIVGRCRNCRLAIWGKPEDGARDEHGYCGISRSPLSRWRALPGANVTGLDVGDRSEGWRVVAEDGREDYGPASPRVHSTHQAAQDRADSLNSDEATAIAEHLHARRTNS